MRRYFIIAGEASGDMHAASLIAQLKKREPEAQFAGLGGDKMTATGCRLYQHIRYMAFMGIATVLANMKQIQMNFRIAHEALLKERPDVLILVDYPSFNLKIAAFCRKHLPQTKIVYYIPPKVWAWKRRRIHSIARLCDEVLGIFPFEPEFYAKYGYKCTYIGNPSVEQLSLLPPKQRLSNTIAILPGSRFSEISHCLPQMLEAARRCKGYSIVVCAYPGMKETIYTPYLQKNECLTYNTYEALQTSTVAIVNSGTATLEAALLKCPQVAVYHLAFSPIVAFFRSWVQPLLFSIKHFTLVNIILGKEVIKECIANDFTIDNVAKELTHLLTESGYKKEMLASYEHLRSLLGSQPAAETAANIITSIPR